MSLSPRHVAVLIDTDDSWGRRLVEAIARFAHENRWALVINPRDELQRLRLPRRWPGDGAIVSLRNRELARHVRSARLPAVDVSLQLPDETWLSRVATDDQRRAEMAFAHLRSRRLQHFACFAPRIGRYSDLRAREFQRAVEAAGFSCEVFPGQQRRRQAWDAEQRRTSRWLRSLNKPVGIFAADPVPARQLTEICQGEGIRIPDEVALLSGDNDDLLCNIATPQISSVELDCARLGRAACEQLMAHWERGRPAETTLLIPPLRVIARHSTEILAIDDSELAEVLRFIRGRALEGIRVSDVLRAFPISRRALEQRFRSQMQTTPAATIRQVKLEHARQLVIETDLPLETIARRCGISSGAELSHAFRRQYGAAPRDLRR